MARLTVDYLTMEELQVEWRTKEAAPAHTGDNGHIEGITPLYGKMAPNDTDGWRPISQKELIMTTKERENNRLIIETLGGAEKIYEGLREYSSHVEYMESQRSKLTKQYPNKWVAMSGGTIVATGDELEELIQAVDSLGISRVGLIVEYLSTEPRNMIL